MVKDDEDEQDSEQPMTDMCPPGPGWVLRLDHDRIRPISVGTDYIKNNKIYFPFRLIWLSGCLAV